MYSLKYFELETLHFDFLVHNQRRLLNQLDCELIDTLYLAPQYNFEKS